MNTRPASQIIREGLAALGQLGRGAEVTGRRLMAGLDAMTAMAAKHGTAGLWDAQAEALAQRARLVRMLAGLQGRADPMAGYAAAHRSASDARDAAQRAAERGGVNPVNLAAYVTALEEIGLAALELGKDPSPQGRTRLGEAAECFSEAAVGHGKLGHADAATLAEVRALEARAEWALREPA